MKCNSEGKKVCLWECQSGKLSTLYGTPHTSALFHFKVLSFPDGCLQPKIIWGTTLAAETKRNNSS